MGTVVVLLFPFGAMFMRMGGSGIIHGIIQVASLCAMLVGLGLGVKLANLTNKSFNNSHTIFGVIIVCLFLIQPLFGLLHHLQYRRNLARAAISHVHIWYGRILMALGIINGGLGLKLAAKSKGPKMAYGIAAGLAGIAYITMCILKRKSKGYALARSKEEIAMGPVSSN